MRLTLPQLAMLVGLISLTFFFSALILAFWFSIDAQSSWHRFQMPAVLWAGTGILLMSSITLEAARYVIRRGKVSPYRKWLTLTLVLAVIFLLLQCVSTWILLKEGVTSQGNPHGSVFYVFMGIHGAHLAIGMGWMVYLWLRSRELFGGTEGSLRRQRTVLVTAAMFWHFLGGLWLVMFAFLRHWSRG